MLMRVFHFIDSVHGIENLKKRHLKISEIDKLNDPFEFLGVASKDKDVRKLYRKLKLGLSQQMGVICFSDTWKNPVLWSHYADRHRGLCLAFDAPNSDELFQVEYRSTRLEPNLTVMNSVNAESTEHIKQIVTTKFDHWSYEGEHRLVATLDEKDPCTGLYFYKFNDKLQLREVIVGACSKVTRAEISRALKEYNAEINVFKARLAFKTFNITRQKLQPMWK